MFNKILIVIAFFHIINAKFIGDNVEPWHAKQNGSTIEIEVDEGYRILVEIKSAEFHDFDEVDPEELPKEPIGYALIKDNKKPSNKIDQLIIAHHVNYHANNSKSYVFNTNKLIGSFYSKNGFLECTFQKFGDKITTTTEEPTTTESPFPTPPHNLTHTNYTSYVYGAEPEKYGNDTLLMFKKAIAQMANEFCTHNTEIHLNETVTSENVKVTYLIECPINWPESDVCVKVTFEVPVVQKKPKSDSYELTTAHLARMWELYADKYLNGSHSRHNGQLSPYDKPTVDKVVTFWALSIALVILVLIVGMLVIRRLYLKNNTRLSITTDRKPIVTDVDPPDMMPHLFQDVPPFFEGVPKRNGTGAGPIPYAEDDDNDSINC